MELAEASRSEILQADKYASGHEIRITTHGKMNAWVDYALKFFEVGS